jgi:hypothetical protein
MDATPPTSWRSKRCEWDAYGNSAFWASLLRSDFVIAPGLWAAIDACQNRQNPAAVDTTGGFAGFGGFVTVGSPDDGKSMDGGVPDSGGTRQMPTLVSGLITAPAR